MLSGLKKTLTRDLPRKVLYSDFVTQYIENGNESAVRHYLENTVAIKRLEDIVVPEIERFHTGITKLLTDRAEEISPGFTARGDKVKSEWVHKHPYLLNYRWYANDDLQIWFRYGIGLPRIYFDLIDRNDPRCIQLMNALFIHFPFENRLKFKQENAVYYGVLTIS